MKKIIECRVIAEPSAGSLNEAIEALLRKGFQPLGNASITTCGAFDVGDDYYRFNGGKDIYAITMVKYASFWDFFKKRKPLPENKDTWEQTVEEKLKNSNKNFPTSEDFPE